MQWKYREDLLTKDTHDKPKRPRDGSKVKAKKLGDGSRGHRASTQLAAVPTIGNAMDTISPRGWLVGVKLTGCAVQCNKGKRWLSRKLQDQVKRG